MQLPIDARRAPFRQKYLDEETLMLNRWFVHGWDPTDSLLYINDGTDDIFEGVNGVQAEAICKARDVFIN